MSDAEDPIEEPVAETFEEPFAAFSASDEAGEFGDDDEDCSLRSKGEDAFGELLQAALESPVLSGAMAKALGAGERAMSAQLR